MMLSRSSTLALIRCSRTRCPTLTRPYAQAAGQQKPWKAPAPALATANTLTLFSADPAAIIIALRSTLAGLLDVAARASSLDGNSDSPPAKNSVLLYALSKNFPPDMLQHALALLNGDQGTGTESASPDIIRLGTLSNCIPLGLLPQHAVSNSDLTDPDEPLHSVALSLLPGSHATPFQSHLAGRAKVQVGRWMHQKERRSRGPESHPADNGQEEAAPSWKDLWGRENARAELPDSIAKIDTSSHLATILFSDPAPHGLLEGLDSHFPQSSLLGLIAPPTPFESNGRRDQTLLFSHSAEGGGGGQQQAAFANGAVGVVLHSSPASSSSTQARPALDRPFPDGLVALPLRNAGDGRRRHALTRARGNIISQLNNSNAAQVFLADLHARRTVGSSTSAQNEQVSDREMASAAGKEEEFYVGVFKTPEAVEGGMPLAEEPILIAPLLSGAPSRGTLSLDTETDLGPGPGKFNQAGEDLGLYVQFFYRPKSRKTAESSSTHTSASTLQPLSIPGPDPTIWAMPRFLFLTLPSTWAEHASETTARKNAALEASTEVRKPKVMALPNLFVAVSEKGWVGKDSVVGGEEGESRKAKEEEGGSGVVERLERQTQWGNVPFGRAVLSLRSRG
ncbi:hypothetical protein A4X13_0g6294 [Tilletia indica]|uniref:Uncharacterized protein n=1 Tax=Tilletia indica TaxID=43049 RepID=A0A177TST0_9BASI|nr:hypothetical protein A4X13_0g6294 [Tilletia indica]